MAAQVDKPPNSAYYFATMASDRIQQRIERLLDRIEQESDQDTCATGANTPQEVATRMEQGFRIIITAPEKSTPGLDEGRRLAGR